MTTAIAINSHCRVHVRGGALLFRVGRTGRRETFVAPTRGEATVFNDVNDALKAAKDYGVQNFTIRTTNQGEP